MVATFVLRSERDRQFAMVAVHRARLGMQVRISKADRTVEQNRLLHGTLKDIADQLPWPKDTGELHDLTWWKRRLTLGWMVETKMEREVVESLEGEEFGLLLPHTSDLTTEQAAALNEWIFMFGATNGVKFKERQPEPPPPEGDGR